jgi:peptide/nickel transport system permease protein
MMSIVKMKKKEHGYFEFWRRFKNNKAGVVGGVVVIIYIGIAILAPIIAPYDPYQVSLPERIQGPSTIHLLGTDELGRDVLSRIIIGARVSLMIQLASVILALIVGVILGSLSGFYGGIVDRIIMGFVDILMAFPSIFLAIIVIAVLGHGLRNVIFAAAAYSIPQFARIIRASFISMKEAEFIEAARAAGETDLVLISFYLLPNTFTPAIVQTTLRLATIMLTVSGLSYLGLGVQPPTPEWGAMLSMGRIYILTAPHVATFPGIAIMLVVLGFNLLGDGLRDSLDPRLKD